MGGLPIPRVSPEAMMLDAVGVLRLIPVDEERRDLDEVAVNESPSGSGFQVALEGISFVGIFKPEMGN